MELSFSSIDYTVFILYLVMIIGLGLYFSRDKKGHKKNAEDYFLASKSLTWVAVGTSLIASNISAEHFIAMSGSGYAIGLAISAYEWLAAIALIFVGKYFLPVFLRKNIFTMPQFLRDRFDSRVSTSLAIFWLLVYVFVNLTSVMYLGALGMEKILGIPMIYGIVGLALFSVTYSLYGGLSAVAWTDVIQVVFLVGGGLVTTYLALDAVSGGGGFFAGLKEIYVQAPSRFELVLTPDNPQYKNLPGIAVLAGAMWLTNFGYWGFNQYIIQRGLAAKSLKEAQRGVILAGYLKILIPLIVVIPGICAYVLGAEISKSDEAYPWLLHSFVPTGLKGLAFAALVAAIVSSLSSMVNSTSTIFTMDLYKPYFNPKASDKILVRTGRIVAFVALLIAVLVAPQLASLDQAFQYIQEYTGFIYPGVFIIFFLGLFWKQFTAKAALWVAILTLPIGFGMMLIWPDMAFFDRMGNVFIVLVAVAIIITFLDKKARSMENSYTTEKAKELRTRDGYILVGVSTALLLVNVFFAHMPAFYMLATGLFMLGFIQLLNVSKMKVDEKSIEVEHGMFKTGMVFNIASIGIVAILAVLYLLFW